MVTVTGNNGEIRLRQATGFIIGGNDFTVNKDVMSMDDD
jgi:hypothetical protein